MTQTPTSTDSAPGAPQPGPGQAGPQPGPRSGVDTENLRHYGGLRRSLTDRKVAGVAGGLGRHLNLDPTIVRVLLVVLVLFGGAGLLLYAAAWLFVPEEQTEDSVIATTPGTRNAVLIIAAVLALLFALGDLWAGTFPWMLAFLGVVAVVVLAARERPSAPRGGPYAGAPAAPAAAAPQAAQAGPEQSAGSSFSYPPSPYAADPAAPVGADASWATTAADAPAGPPAPPSWSAPPAAAYPPKLPKRERGPKLFGPTLALIAIGLGVLGLVDAAGGPIADPAYPALALTIVGVMLVVGSKAGRPGGLILLGLLASFVLLVSATVGGYDSPDNVSVAPLTSAELADSYSMFAGQMVVNLTQISDLDGLDGRTVLLSAEAGDMIVLVPPGLDVDVRGSISVGGEIDVLDETRTGRNPRLDTTIDGGPDAPELTLVVDLTVGQIDVRQDDTTLEGNQR